MVPDENRMESLLTHIQPVPSERFHQKMKQAAWQIDPGQKTDIKNLRFKVGFTIATLVLVSALLVTPQGRAWAQELVQFFKRIEATTIPLSEEQQKEIIVPIQQYELPLVKVLEPALSPEMAGIPECQNAQDPYAYACQFAYAESKLGFDLKEFPAGYDDWKFESLYFDQVRKSAFSTYRLDTGDLGYGQLTFQQTLGVPERPLAQIPADQVRTVKIGPYNGEYVKGGFIPANDLSKMVWEDSDFEQRLAWSDGTRWYFLQLFGNAGEAKSIGRDQLIELAAGLVDHPAETAEPLDPNYLRSISDAEKVSGLDLKAPSLLPLGVDFSSAQYLPGSHKVTLHYGVGDELVIHEWKGTPTNFDETSPATTLSYEIVEVGGNNALYSFSNEINPYWHLWWSQGDMNYQIYYYQYLSDGGTLTKEKLIAIAESMSDINAVQGNTLKPYEYVAVYEQALGFDVKEFPKSPAGWSFTSVYASARPDCITVLYSMQKEAGMLSLHQCSSNTDEMFDRYNIPANAIEQVEVARNKGRYITGNVDFQEPGKAVWNVNLPCRILRWQEDGRWNQITIRGDSILIYGKEDLISYAESLR